MKKRIIAALTTLTFLATFITASYATSITCAVESIDNGKVILSCGELADKLKAGEKVKVRTKTKRKAIEGC